MEVYIGPSTRMNSGMEEMLMEEGKEVGRPQPIFHGDKSIRAYCSPDFLFVFQYPERLEFTIK
jgi:hypothetical protein